VLTFIDASAPSQGVPTHLSTYLVAIANAGSAIGRLSSGILADRIGASSLPFSSRAAHASDHLITPGPLNVMAPAVFFAGVLTFLWPHAQGAGTLIPLAIFYGATSGAFAGLIAAPLIPMGDSSDVGRRIGMFLTVLSLGALAGPPISGAIAHATGGYTAVGIYAGKFRLLSPLPVTLEVLYHIHCWDRY
jgi:MFS family permease